MRAPLLGLLTLGVGVGLGLALPARADREDVRDAADPEFWETDLAAARERAAAAKKPLLLVFRCVP